MKNILILTLFLLVFLGCDYFTDDTETETETETSPVAPAPANWEALLQDRGNWELLATLERDVRQQYWHLFYVQPDIKPLILQAFADGKEFLFVIVNPRINSTGAIQFYFAQPEGMEAWRVDDRQGRPLSARVDLFYPSPAHWYSHWGPETNLGGQIKRERAGFVATFDMGFGGWQFENTDEDWVLGEVEFRATREGTLFATSYAPHIKEGYVLKIFAR